jgi:hypothetical protein
VAGESIALFDVSLQAHELVIEKPKIEWRTIDMHFILAYGQKPYVSVATMCGKFFMSILEYLPIYRPLINPSPSEKPLSKNPIHSSPDAKVFP